MLAKALASASASAPKVYVEDVFSTWLYTGNGSTQTITNGIDLSGKGGLVWLKDRSQAYDHGLFDTERGAGNRIISNSTAAQNYSLNYISTFNNNGFSLGAPSVTTNNSGDSYVSWAFRKAAKFFDVVTFTTAASTPTYSFSHALGSTPGCIIIKDINNADDWYVWHRSLDPAYNLALNQTAAQANRGATWITTVNSTTVASSVTGGANPLTANRTYVAYLFAHDAGGFGDSGNDSVVSCGSYTGNGSTSGPTVTLGWEPQWLLFKRTDGNTQWFMHDNMREMSLTNTAYLNAADSAAEALFGSALYRLLPNGFQINTNNPNFNASGGTYIYIAIRRGPMKTPTDATKVFSVKATSGTNTTNFPVDMFLYAIRAGDAQNSFVASRLTGGNGLSTALTSAERADGWTGWDSNTTRGSLGGGDVEWDFRRAPGFFDVVAYTGTGSARTVSHNLGVVPELMIVRMRDGGGIYAGNNWFVYSAALGATQAIILNSVNAAFAVSAAWNDTAPTASVFSLGNGSAVNGSSPATYIAYLFASCPGVSKVGSYTGSSNDINVDCGFTNGARFVLIKRVNDTGSWFVWDTARGITSGNDPYLLLNSTAAEVTNTDYLDPYSAGFTVPGTNVSPGVNNPGDTFIFLAIA